MYDLLVDDGIPEHTAKKRAHNKSYDALRPTERLKAKLPADMDKRAAGSVDALTSSLKEVVEQRVDPALERRKATMMKLKVDPVQFESTHDMMKFMGDAAMHAHKHMYENWGGMYSYQSPHEMHAFTTGLARMSVEQQLSSTIFS